MKIIFLNAWHGRMQDALSEFIKVHTRDTDVFCFQEAAEETQDILKDILEDYSLIYAYKYVSEHDAPAVSTYVKKGIRVTKSATVFPENPNVGLGLYMQLEIGGTKVNICNFHGLSRPVEKLDEPNRVKASQELVDYFDSKDGITIIGGDFNVLPTTTSEQMFESNEYKDLIKDFKITTTRNRLVWEIYPKTKMMYSDYVFVDKHVNVKRFLVPKNEVSDHLPMLLEVAV